MSAPHFRIVYPRRLIGTRHIGSAGRIFVTWPGETEEFEIPSVSFIQPHYPLDGAVDLNLTILGSVAVQYRDDDEPLPEMGHPETRGGRP